MPSGLPFRVTRFFFTKITGQVRSNDVEIKMDLEYGPR